MHNIKFESDKNAVIAQNKASDKFAGTAYSETNAHALTRFSILAYDDDTTHREAKAWGFDDVRIINRKDGDSRAIICVSEENIVVSFRGTANFSNAVTDIRFSGSKVREGGISDKAPEYEAAYKKIGSLAQAKTGRGMLVHRGFRDSLREMLKDNAEEGAGVLSQLREVITQKNATGKPYQIWITGHSLGGAYATLTRFEIDYAMQVTDNKPGALCGLGLEGKDIMVYTIGSPKCGNTKFAQRYNNLFKDQTFRIVNHDDPIPKLPAFYGLMHYDHVGHSATYYGDEIHFNMGTTERVKLAVANATKTLMVAGPALAANRVASTMAKTVVASTGADDHAKVKYLEAISNSLATQGIVPFVQDTDRMMSDYKALQAEHEALKAEHQQMLMALTCLGAGQVNTATCGDVVEALHDSAQAKVVKFEQYGTLLRDPRYTAAVGEEKAQRRIQTWETVNAARDTLLTGVTHDELDSVTEKARNHIQGAASPMSEVSSAPRPAA